MHIKGDNSVSEKHAVISWSGKQWEIVDKGSTNGTLLNGAELEEKGDPVRLADGDTLVIGAETTAKVKVRRRWWNTRKFWGRIMTVELPCKIILLASSLFLPLCPPHRRKELKNKPRRVGTVTHTSISLFLSLLPLPPHPSSPTPATVNPFFFSTMCKQQIVKARAAKVNDGLGSSSSSEGEEDRDDEDNEDEDTGRRIRLGGGGGGGGSGSVSEGDEEEAATKTTKKTRTTAPPSSGKRSRQQRDEDDKEWDTSMDHDDEDGHRASAAVKAAKSGGQVGAGGAAGKGGKTEAGTCAIDFTKHTRLVD